MKDKSQQEVKEKVLHNGYEEDQTVLQGFIAILQDCSRNAQILYQEINFFRENIGKSYRIRTFFY